MKVRIVRKSDSDNWYKINSAYNVVEETESHYMVSVISGILKEDAEVVEDEKSCDNCNLKGTMECKISGCEGGYWKPIKPTISKTETVEKSCEACRFNNVNCENETKKYCKHDNRLFYWQPKWLVEDDILDEKEPLINLIKITTQSGFSRYVNPAHIISITEIEGGTSIATSDRDGDYLVVDSIDDVLEKLGYSE